MSAHLVVFASAQEQSAVATTIVAIKVRSQGFICNNPSSATRIAAESAPDKPVYLLRCDAVAYRVVLIPDQAALVTVAEPRAY